ncbi:hypothetical protein C3V39_12430 [Prevotella sp. oral taxon 820]|nr:hypothetical protein C3V39_12430 [Prevotella sp. oral taxon 820]
MQKIGGIRQIERKFSLHMLAQFLQKIGGARQIESKLSLHSLAQFLHRDNIKGGKNMNIASMNNLWSYLQGLSLSAQNRHWLAKKLMASVEEPTMNPAKGTVITETDIMVSPEVAALVKGFELPDTFDAKQAKLDYLVAKYK